MISMSKQSPSWTLSFLKKGRKKKITANFASFSVLVLMSEEEIQLKITATWLV